MAEPAIHPLSRVTNDSTNNNEASILDNLPTLNDVLYRHSEPPVCLYNYYIILRDRLELETLLDFWLDVAQADILYKRYLKYLRKASNVSKQQKPSISSSILDYNKRLSHQPSSPLSIHHRTSDVLTHMLLLHPRASIATTMNSNTTTINSNLTNKKPPPTQHEMNELMERIYLRYLVPNAEKELTILPQNIKESISNQFNNTSEKALLPENPIVFSQAKNYVFEILELSFPLFLRYKVFMNLTLPQQIGRLATGLIFLLVGFSLEFTLIFLDVHPWQKRLWVSCITLKTLTLSYELISQS